MRNLGFDIRELEYYLECNGKTLEEFIKWSKQKKKD